MSFENHMREIFTETGLMDEDCEPTDQLWRVLAECEASRIVDSYCSHCELDSSLDLAATLMEQYLDDENDAALCVLLRNMYEHCGLPQPRLLEYLTDDEPNLEGFISFCDNLCDRINGFILGGEPHCDDDFE